MIEFSKRTVARYPKRSFAALAVVGFVITESGRYIYRPWVYENQIRDFALADSIGSLGGTITMCLLAVAVFPKERKEAIANSFGISIGCVIYEFLQPFLKTGIFDIMDVFGALSGGMIATSVVAYYWPRAKLRKHEI